MKHLLWAHRPYGMVLDRTARRLLLQYARMYFAALGLAYAGNQAARLQLFYGAGPSHLQDSPAQVKGQTSCEAVECRLHTTGGR